MPGAKQIFRFTDRDQIACSWECTGCGHGDDGPRALIRPVIIQGRLIHDLPSARASRDYAQRCVHKLPLACRSLFESEDPYPVEYSAELRARSERVRAQVHA